MIRYFAYGSNLLRERLQERTPSAKVRMIAKLPGHRLRFHKVGEDQSGKCDAFPTDSIEQAVWGVVYDLDDQELTVLDAIEGTGYRRLEVNLETLDNTVSAWTYLARDHCLDITVSPFHWYKRLVLAGARQHGFDDDYLDQIAETPSSPDPNWSRASRNHRLLRQYATEYFPDWPLQHESNEDH